MQAAKPYNWILMNWNWNHLRQGRVAGSQGWRDRSAAARCVSGQIRSVDDAVHGITAIRNDGTAAAARRHTISRCREYKGSPRRLYTYMYYRCVYSWVPGRRTGCPPLKTGLRGDRAVPLRGGFMLGREEVVGMGGAAARERTDNARVGAVSGFYSPYRFVVWSIYCRGETNRV
jgi:hypothetical protein